MLQEKFEDTMDPTVKPQDDFYRYANGKWLKNTEIPPDKSRWGSFTVLRDRSLDDVKSLLETEFTSGEYKNASVFFKVGMDSSRLDQEDYTPIKPFLEQINAIQTRDELKEVIITLEDKGLLGYTGFSSNQDRKNTDIEIPHFSSGGLSLPSSRFGNRDFYLEEDKEPIREEYLKYLEKLFGFIGENDPSALAQRVLSFEKSLAEKHYTQVQKRDPELSYNKMDFSEFKTKYSNFLWDTYVSKFTDVELSDIVVDNPPFFEFINNQIEEEDLENWKTYLKARVMNRSASYLSQRFEEASFDFYGKVISGQKEMEDRWKRVVGMMNNRFILGELVGKLYVEKFFPASSKAKMLDLVNNLIEALEQRIHNLDWMGEETKKKALVKLKAFNVKIGYPDEWEDYSSLDLDESDSYLNILNKCTRLQRDNMLSRLYKAPDRKKWFMSPQTVNAYYSPLKNEIVFPAAILQFPFFDPNMTDAENYGGIGAVIGHEISHGYDDKGSMFDANGNMNNWWTDEDRRQFNERSEHFMQEYEKFLVNGKPLIGKLTLGENIGDLGGLRISFHAMENNYKKLGREESGDYTKEQLFFMSYARIWRSLSRPEIAEMLRVSDPHSPPEARVNVALANIPEFHQTYPTKPGDGMHRETIVELW